MPDASARHLTPEAAVDKLEEMHAAAAGALRRALARVAGGGPPPDAAEARSGKFWSSFTPESMSPRSLGGGLPLTVKNRMPRPVFS